MLLIIKTIDESLNTTCLVHLQPETSSKSLHLSVWWKPPPRPTVTRLLCCIQVPVSVGQVKGSLSDCLHSLFTLYQHIHTFPDLHMKQRDRNQSEARKSVIVCGGSSPVSSPEKPGSETQRLRGEGRGGEGGWNDMWKLINKYIFSPSYCVLPESISFKEWRLNRLICSELPAGSTRSRCIKL